MTTDPKVPQALDKESFFIKGSSSSKAEHDRVI